MNELKTNVPNCHDKGPETGRLGILWSDVQHSRAIPAFGKE